MHERVGPATVAVLASRVRHGLNRQRKRKRPHCWTRSFCVARPGRRMEAACVLAPDVASLVVERERGMAAVGRTFQLGHPSAVGGCPGDAVLGSPGAEPGRTLVPDWIGSS